MFGRQKSWALTRDGDAPGWLALEAALAVRGLAEPMHFPTGDVPGGRGAYAINAYRRADHWLMTTWGLSDLFGDAPHRRAGAGWGVELTLRTPLRMADVEPRQWARLLLTALAESSVARGMPYAAGEVLDTGGAISGRKKSSVRALVFADDPELVAVSTPHGPVRWVTAYGITAVEQGMILAAGAQSFLDGARDANPLLVTDELR